MIAYSIMANASDERPEAKLANLPAIALREAWLWSLGVHKLCASIGESRDEVQSQVDAMLLAVSFRNVQRAARLALAHVRPDARPRLRQAIAEADRLAGDVAKVRDMLEHFDDYEAGVATCNSPAFSEGIGCRMRSSRVVTSSSLSAAMTTS